VFPEMGEPRRWFVQVTEKIDAAHGLVANARLRTAANVNPATPYSVGIKATFAGPLGRCERSQTVSINSSVVSKGNEASPSMWQTRT
jgi:hypothetical protein